MESDVFLEPHPHMEKVARIGKRTLARRGDGQWFVRCQNRTYDSRWIPIPAARVNAWKEHLR